MSDPDNWRKWAKDIVERQAEEARRQERERGFASGGIVPASGQFWFSNGTEIVQPEGVDAEARTVTLFTADRIFNAGVTFSFGVYQPPTPKKPFYINQDNWIEWDNADDDAPHTPASPVR